MNTTVLQGSDFIFSNRSRSNITLESSGNLIFDNTLKDLDYFRGGSTDTITTVAATDHPITDIYCLSKNIVKTSSNYTYDSGTKRLTFNTEGVYLINVEFEISWISGSPAFRQFALNFNRQPLEVRNVSRSVVSTNVPTKHTMTYARYVQAGDSFSITFRQNNSLVVGNTTRGLYLTIVKLTK